MPITLFSQSVTFDNTPADKFAEACTQIESDPNYRGDVFTDAQLLDLIKGTNERCIAMSAVAIVKSDIVGPNGSGKSYVVSKANWKNRISDFSMDSETFTDIDYHLLVVNLEGKFTFYHPADAKLGDFSHPQDYLKTDEFLQNLETPVHAAIKDIGRLCYNTK